MLAMLALCTVYDGKGLVCIDFLRVFTTIQQTAAALQAVLVRASARLLKRALSETDERSKLEGELVSGIEVVKCSAWEVRS